MREEGVLTLLKRKDLVGKVQDIEVPSLLRRVSCVSCVVCAVCVIVNVHLFFIQNNKRLSLYEKMKLKVSIKSALDEKQKSDRRKAGLDDEADEAAEAQKTSAGGA